MSTTQRLRKWHFLMLGGILILFSYYLWYWNWRFFGIPSNPLPEHYMTIASFIVGVFILGVFVYRLTKRQVTIMLIGLTVVILLAALSTLWVFRTYPGIFEFIQPADLTDVDQAYLVNWRAFFLEPPIYATHAGLLLLWVETLVMYLIRKPADQPA